MTPPFVTPFPTYWYGLEMPIKIRNFGIPKLSEYRFGIRTDSTTFYDNFGQTQLPKTFSEKTGKLNVDCLKKHSPCQDSINVAPKNYHYDYRT